LDRDFLFHPGLERTISPRWRCPARLLEPTRIIYADSTSRGIVGVLGHQKVTGAPEDDFE